MFKHAKNSTVAGKSVRRMGVSVPQILYDENSYDQHLDKVQLLMDFDGTNGSTTFTDWTGNTTTTTAYGNASLSTTISRNGGSSLYLDGTGDYITLVNPNAAPGKEDWCFEAWVRCYAVNRFAQLFGSISSNTIRFYQDSTDLWFLTSSSSIVRLSGVLTTGSFQYIAVGRHKGRHYITCGDKNAYGGHNLYNVTTDDFIIGYDSTNAYFYGYIDSIRVTVGASRYSLSVGSNNTGGWPKAIIPNTYLS